MKKVVVLVLLLVLTNVSAAADESGTGVESIVNPACMAANKEKSGINDNDEEMKSEQESDPQEAYLAYLECLTQLE